MFDIGFQSFVWLVTLLVVALNAQVAELQGSGLVRRDTVASVRQNRGGTASRGKRRVLKEQSELKEIQRAR